MLSQRRQHGCDDRRSPCTWNSATSSPVSLRGACEPEHQRVVERLAGSWMPDRRKAAERGFGGGAAILVKAVDQRPAPTARMTATPARPGALESAKMVEASVIWVRVRVDAVSATRFPKVFLSRILQCPDERSNAMTENRLEHETSPYLLQHKDNPVHWWAWGPEALAEAKRTGKPILLSVGYAACHWCHVMAHESFEDAATAAVMNELFVNIKVDREERPDIDAIYMRALHRLRRAGRLAADHVPRQRGAAVLGRHVFPTRDRATAGRLRRRAARSRAGLSARSRQGRATTPALMRAR